MAKHYASVSWTGPDGEPYVQVTASWESRERAEESAKRFARQLAPGTVHEVTYLGHNGAERY
jgi:hypothetical protein